MDVRAVIDRFEGSKAVLLIGEEEKPVIWPQKFLPDGINEGDILAISIRIDEEATCHACQEAGTLLKQLLADQSKP